VERRGEETKHDDISVQENEKGREGVKRRR
jgi:hypothetical protein